MICKEIRDCKGVNVNEIIFVILRPSVINGTIVFAEFVIMHQDKTCAVNVLCRIER